MDDRLESANTHRIAEAAVFGLAPVAVGIGLVLPLGSQTEWFAWVVVAAGFLIPAAALGPVAWPGTSRDSAFGRGAMALAATFAAALAAGFGVLPLVSEPTAAASACGAVVGLVVYGVGIREALRRGTSTGNAWATGSATAVVAGCIGMVVASALGAL